MHLFNKYLSNTYCLSGIFLGTGDRVTTGGLILGGMVKETLRRALNEEEGMDTRPIELQV
jgi:hypothetical protein